jgi:RNA polymerase sigma-70 factor (ECF subfamily)
MIPEVDEQVLRALHARGRAAWPEVELELATFAALAAPRLREGPIEVIRAGELYLAIACAARIDPALAAFDRHYLAGLAPALIRRGHDAATAADAVQSVRVRFLVGDDDRGPRISEYDGRGALATWIRVAATRIAISAHRKQHRDTAEDLDVAAAERSPDLDLLRRRFGAAFDAAFRATFEALAPRERTLLRYQVIDRLGIDRIAAIHGVHRATAARWVAHAREALVAGVRRALQTRLRVGSAELDSLLRLVRSKLELSLRLLLTPGPERGADPSTLRSR